MKRTPNIFNPEVTLTYLYVIGVDVCDVLAGSPALDDGLLGEVEERCVGVSQGRPQDVDLRRLYITRALVLNLNYYHFTSR